MKLNEESKVEISPLSYLHFFFGITGVFRPMFISMHFGSLIKIGHRFLSTKYRVDGSTKRIFIFPLQPAIYSTIICNRNLCS